MSREALIILQMMVDLQGAAVEGKSLASDMGALKAGPKGATKIAAHIAEASTMWANFQTALEHYQPEGGETVILWAANIYRDSVADDMRGLAELGLYLAALGE